MAKSYRNRNVKVNRSYAGGYGSRRRSRRPGLVMAILFGALLVGVGIGLFTLMKPDGSGAANPSATNGTNSVSGLNGDRFYDGISVDGIALGGLTRDDAKRQIEAKQKDTLKTLGVTIIDTEGKKTQLLVSDLPKDASSFDTDAILDKAWSIGREGTNKERQAALKQLSTTPMELTTTATADPSQLEQNVRKLASSQGTPPQDAQLDLKGFDASKTGVNRLSFIAEVPGQQVNADKLWDAVKTSFTSGTFADVQMSLETVQPDVTVPGLKSDLQLVKISPITVFSSDSTNQKLNAANVGHTYTTQISDHSTPRLTNIRLANEAVSCILKPGEVFSMNAKTGDRTQDQGYQIAKIDRSGVVDRGLGGGVCQTSGTLYNAAVRYGGKYAADDSKMKIDKSQPGLTVTMRDSHSLPSAYLRTGTDATVDIGSKKDLQLRNDFDKPVVIVLYYDKTSKGEYFEHCDIFGPALPDGATYDLLRKNVVSVPADTTTPPKTVYSNYAAPGAPVYIEPRDGYNVDIYIEKNMKGEKSEVLAYSDNYKAQPAYYYVYTGETAPTPTPSITPSPTPSPTPTQKPTKTEQTVETPTPTPVPESTTPG